MSFWTDADSSMLYQHKDSDNRTWLDHCGDTTLTPLPHQLPFVVGKDNKLATALDKEAIWAHDANHLHYISLDLGKPHYITRLRGKLTVNTNVKHVVFHVGDDIEHLGNPVYETENWQELTPEEDGFVYVASIPKMGRYMRIGVVSTTHPDNYLRWG